MCGLAPGGHRHSDHPHQETRIVRPQTPGLALPGVSKVGFQGEGSSQAPLAPYEELAGARGVASPLHPAGLWAPKSRASLLVSVSTALSTWQVLEVLDRQMEEQADGWIDEWINGWMDG